MIPTQYLPEALKDSFETPGVDNQDALDTFITKISRNLTTQISQELEARKSSPDYQISRWMHNASVTN